MLCTGPVLSQCVARKLWCQLPEDDQIITPKLTAAMWKGSTYHEVENGCFVGIT